MQILLAVQFTRDEPQREELANAQPRRSVHQQMNNSKTANNAPACGERVAARLQGGLSTSPGRFREQWISKWPACGWSACGTGQSRSRRNCNCLGQEISGPKRVRR